MRPGIIDRDDRQAGLLDRVHVIIFGPVGVLDDELAARSGHDTRSRFAAPQGTGVRIAEIPERVAERRRARGFQDEWRIRRKVRAISAQARVIAASVRIPPGEWPRACMTSKTLLPQPDRVPLIHQPGGVRRGKRVVAWIESLEWDRRPCAWNMLFGREELGR